MRRVRLDSESSIAAATFRMILLFLRIVCVMKDIHVSSSVFCDGQRRTMHRPAFPWQTSQISTLTSAFRKLRDAVPPRSLREHPQFTLGDFVRKVWTVASRV